MTRGQADARVRELGERIGLPELALDEGGTAVIVIGQGGTVQGGTIVSVGFAQSTGTLDLMICLDSVEPSLEVALEVLGANFAWMDTDGATFAIDPVSQALVLQHRCQAADATDGGLFAAFAALIETAEAWSERLSQAASHAEESPRTAAPAGMVRA
jgi:hypothetical protein